ncbi:pentapeptide repeat-containing protein [Sulfitobacter pontiacus]|uniref:pentapeptide repeat-containing protein n=1 Tax=Sulfitobacter pontiacus TaxID=60137 RepID=UPI0030EC1DBD|tara:strand:- start:2630 stop:3799 length:1170 start_codon:yes stop_codon:yes gene_type:complete
MKNDVILSEIYPDKEVRGALQKITSLDEDFATIADAIGLEKEHDFQQSNLRKVDFSYSDLRGFNFAGADLTQSYGLDILIDETTTFVGATLAGSVFEKQVREQDFFRSHGKAARLYEMLKSGDTYDVSQWISSRSGYLGTMQLKDLSEDDAAVLCQKLITDEIDLTKRTTLFYHLKDFTHSQRELYSIVSDFVAFHLDNPSVIRSFVKVAGDLLSKDPFVAKTILKLCTHRDDSVREVAFSAVSYTPLFVRNFEGVCKLFFADQNRHIRKKFILETAAKLSNSHVLSVNTVGENRNADPENVLDFDEMLRERGIIKVHASQKHRQSQQSSREILERQQEVLVVTPVIGKILERRGVEWVDDAKSRSSARYDDFYRYLATKIDNGFKRSR